MEEVEEEEKEEERREAASLVQHAAPHIMAHTRSGSGGWRRLSVGKERLFKELSYQFYLNVSL